MVLVDLRPKVLYSLIHSVLTQFPILSRFHSTSNFIRVIFSAFFNKQGINITSFFYKMAKLIKYAFFSAVIIIVKYMYIFIFVYVYLYIDIYIYSYMQLDEAFQYFKLDFFLKKKEKHKKCTLTFQKNLIHAKSAI